jgi:hypothetical protein
MLWKLQANQYLKNGWFVALQVFLMSRSTIVQSFTYFVLFPYLFVAVVAAIVCYLNLHLPILSVLITT